VTSRAIWAVLLLCASAGHASVVVSCPFGNFGDDVDRGFYVTGYAGDDLHTVRLRYETGAAPGVYQIALTARLDAYDGPVLGTQRAAFGPGVHEVVYNFGAVPVPFGSTITFTQELEAAPVGADVVYDLGVGPCTGLTETQGTTPPLDVFRRNRVGVVITQLDPGPCEPSPTTLCIDDQPEDRRFRLEMPYYTSQAGGKFGQAGAIPTTQLGVVRGGLFWIGSAGNPEMLAKVLNACPFSGHYWVFASAGTNQGFDLYVIDTVTGARRTYNNPDLNPAVPIQDTEAFPCD
jgi:hypothetical protein